MKATRLLLREHRNIEQALAVLTAVRDVSNADFDALARDLLGHLASEEKVLYPAAEKMLSRELTAHRAQHTRVVMAVIVAASRSLRAPCLRARLVDLSAVFAAHVRLEEAVLHSCLEGTMSDASLEELSVRVSCCRAVAIAEAVDAYAMDADPTAKLVAE